ncbi:hypothetical protein BDP27DRAFT_328966 [Rhodocollybia butyracea]|uniref:Fungal-type protein kinase domain-containing protein n=1 Tax=Rhodocollybia butyracea TaxID=206335 RepID=A0A9P5QA16_9AGAR|nr:hypothetical protein BDP27DRAFT_328966 [Rhodocollybia butyracea]
MTSIKSPSTPPPVPAKSHSTPLNQGSSSHSSFQGRYSQKHYEAYLQFDVFNAQRISLDEFLRQVCGFSDGWLTQRQCIWKDLALSRSIADKLETLNHPTGLEPNLYAPFATLANALLDGLGYTDVRFCRNDNKIISGPYSSRKPHLVVVRAASLGHLVGKKGSACVVKLSLPAKTRLSESNLFDEARKLASRTDWQWVLQHLPEIVYSTELPSTQTQIRPEAFLKDAYEQRVLRIVVMAELFPMADLTDPADLEIVFRDVFNCYRWLCEYAKVLHRDLSVANIMFRRGSNGRVYGVLNDFDHAVRIGPAIPQSSHQRTGTAPFMAIDILNEIPPPVHLYRHDLESLYYVLVCTVCPADLSYIKDWFSLSGPAMAKTKRSFFVEPNPVPRPDFEVFLKWMKPIHRAFTLGLVAQSSHAGGYQTDQPYDHETLGGNVSFDSFSTIFDIKLVEHGSDEAGN